MTMMLENSVRDLWIDDAFCRRQEVEMVAGEMFRVTEDLPKLLDKCWLPKGDYCIVQSYPDHGLAEVAKIVDDAVEGKSLLHFLSY